MPEDSDQFEARLRGQLRDSETALDTRTGARLAAARRAAVEQENTGRTDRGWSLSLGRPAWGALAVALIVAVLINLPQNTERPVPQTSATPEPAPLAADNGADATAEENEQLELYENLELLEFYEDLEFYEWLADTELEELPS